MALVTVRTNKLRSLLTILGVSVGVITVIFMVSIIQGLNKSFAAQLEALGSNSIWATKFDPSFGHQPNSEELHRKELTLEDYEYLKERSTLIAKLGAKARGTPSQIYWGRKSRRWDFRSTSPRASILSHGHFRL